MLAENDYEGNEQKIEIEDYESYNIENLLTRYWKAIMRHWNVEVLKDFQRQEQLGRQIQHKLSFLNQLIYKLASVKKERNKQSLIRNFFKTKHFRETNFEKYDIEEEDFVSAEIEVVPSGKARDYGLDRSMVAGYGHDDRVCAYTSLTAILDSDVSEYTSCAILVDKEEIGSVGATGAHSLFFENTVAELLLKMGIDSFVQTRLTMSRSKMLSSDVSAGVDPLFVNVNDKKNAAYLGNGIVFNKYTGSRGKSGSNDASAEYVAQVRAVMDNANIHYQTAELGRVDQGGGGTIAYILGNYNMDVIDAGIAVLNMHAPMEIVSKVDVYETYQAYKAFLKDA